MTTEQLQSIGITTGSWLTLENKCVNIQLSNDGHLYPSPKSSQYFFDAVTKLLFVRYTEPFLRKEKLNEDFVPVELSMGKGFLRLFPGGSEFNVTGRNIGRYHEVFTFESITSIQ